jgi:hypothetical protein
MVRATAAKQRWPAWLVDAAVIGTCRLTMMLYARSLAISFDAVNLTEEVRKSYYAFADAGGPDMFNFGNTLISRQFALGVQWKLNQGR